MTGFPNLVAAIALLALGVVELAVVNHSVYPALRWRHEMAKAEGRQTTDPNRILLLVRIQSLVLMPLLGLLFGGRLKALMG
jgi:hypothetical protein